jgi:hypothetical protein
VLRSEWLSTNIWYSAFRQSAIVGQLLPLATFDLLQIGEPPAVILIFPWVITVAVVVKY